MTPTLAFTCSICGEQSKEICVFCTKDACRNHRCARCQRCSDCCECEVPLTAEEPEVIEPVIAEPLGGFSDIPPAPAGAPWVDVLGQEPAFPRPPIEPDPPPAPEPFPPRPEPFPQPEPEPRPEPPVPHPQMGLPPGPGPEPEPPFPRPEPEPEPQPDTPASDHTDE